MRLDFWWGQLKWKSQKKKKNEKTEKRFPSIHPYHWHHETFGRSVGGGGDDDIGVMLFCIAVWNTRCDLNLDEAMLPHVTWRRWSVMARRSRGRASWQVRVCGFWNFFYLPPLLMLLLSGINFYAIIAGAKKASKEHPNDCTEIQFFSLCPTTSTRFVIYTFRYYSNNKSAHQQEKKSATPTSPCFPWLPLRYTWFDLGLGWTQCNHLIWAMTKN